ncbi:MAG: acylneuraminate cytidylyltransferase family protein [Syntrophomonas sp.]
MVPATHKHTLYAIITARGGSKRLPGKNIKMLCGKPLIAYSIEAALNCSYVKRCIVSTEDPKIKEVSLQYGAEVIDRPSYLAADSTLSSAVVRHVLEELKSQDDVPDNFVLLQPTSPLRTSDHLSSAIERFYSSSQDCLVSITEAEHHPYKSLIYEDHLLSPLIDKSLFEQPQQALPRAYRTNGAIYIINSAVFLQENSFFVPPVCSFEMDAMSSVDVDTELDFRFAEFLLRERGISS